MSLGVWSSVCQKHKFSAKWHIRYKLVFVDAIFICGAGWSTDHLNINRFSCRSHFHSINNPWSTLSSSAYTRWPTNGRPPRQAIALGPRTPSDPFPCVARLPQPQITHSRSRATSTGGMNWDLAESHGILCRGHQSHNNNINFTNNRDHSENASVW